MNAAGENTRRDLAALVERFGEARVLCVGDLMLDHFAYGEVSRISPESPVPVLKLQRGKRMLGGVGNAVRNLATLGAKASLIAVVGDDAPGSEVLELLDECACANISVTTEPSRPTTLKTRFVAQGQQLMRTDVESSAPIAPVTLQQLLADFAELVKECSVVLLSDYAKGVLSGDNVQKFIRIARDAGKPVIVDPKGADYSRYRGAAVLKPNLKELRQASGAACESDEQIIDAATHILDAYEVGHLLVTRGPAGMLLVSAAGRSFSLPAEAREVFDVSGAGDTVGALLACALALNAPLPQAAQLANFAAGLAVGKAGTATVDRAELLDCVQRGSWAEDKGKSPEHDEAQDAARRWNKLGLKVAFAHGSFSPERFFEAVQRLQEERSQCDRLIVGVSGDAVSSAPMLSLLAAVEFVDLVIAVSGDPAVFASGFHAQLVVDVDSEAG